MDTYSSNVWCLASDATLGKDALFSWHVAFVGKKGRRRGEYLIYDYFKSIRKSFDNFKMVNQAIVWPFMHVFLDWVSVYLGFISLSLLYFIFWRGCFFFFFLCIPLLFWPLVHYVHGVYFCLPYARCFYYNCLYLLKKSYFSCSGETPNMQTWCISYPIAESGGSENCGD